MERRDCTACSATGYSRERSERLGTQTRIERWSRHGGWHGAGDEWLGVDNWRVRKLDDVALYARKQKRITALVARDGRLLRCPLEWPTETKTVRLLKAR